MKLVDIFESVELGIDSFDCVIPTREARHGGIWTKAGRFDVKKSVYQNDQSRLEENCLCPACQAVTKSELRALFKIPISVNGNRGSSISQSEIGTKNPLAGEYATVHNVYFFNNLMAEIREAIRNGRLAELKKEYLKS